MRKRRFRIKKKGRAIGRILILLAALLVIVGLIWGAISLLKSFTKKDEALEALPFDANANYTYTGTGFLYFGDGRLNYKDIADSRKDASYKINTEELKLAASSGVSVLYHDAVVQIVGAGEPIMFSGRVLGVICGNEHIAVLREESGGNTGIVIYDNKGIQTDQMDFDATDLVSFGFSNTAEETLWTLETDYSAPTPVSTITTYNLTTKRTTGVMSVQSQLISDVIFTNNSLFVSGTGDLIRFALAGSSEAYRMSVYGWELMDYSLAGSSPMLLYKERESEGLSTVKVYSLPEGDVGSAKVDTIHPSGDVLSTFLINGKLRTYTADSVMTYSGNGELASTEPLPVKIEKATKLSDNHVLLESEGKLYLSAAK